MFTHSLSGYMDTDNWLRYKNPQKNQPSMYFKRDEPSRPDNVCSVLTIFLKLSSQTQGLADVAQSPPSFKHSVTGMSARRQHVCNPQ